MAVQTLMQSKSCWDTVLYQPLKYIPIRVLRHYTIYINKLIRGLNKKEVIMKLRIQSINFVATQALESYVTKKTKKLNRLLDDIINVEVYLKVVKPETATNKEAEIEISVPSAEFFASKVCDTFEEAVDLSLEALERQIVKFKDKLMKK